MLILTSTTFEWDLQPNLDVGSRENAINDAIPGLTAESGFTVIRARQVLFRCSKFRVGRLDDPIGCGDDSHEDSHDHPEKQGVATDMVLSGRLWCWRKPG